MFILFLTALAAGLLSQATFAEEDSGSGKVTGGVHYTVPGWFKSSFLDFDEEVSEAREQGKHVIAFLHLDECPYCARMLDENFREGEARAFMEERFEVIAVNVLGDLPVDWIDGETYSEKELTKHLKAIGTPTIVFLDFDGNKVLQLSGYRDAGAYRHALGVRGRQAVRDPELRGLRGLDVQGGGLPVEAAPRLRTDFILQGPGQAAGGDLRGRILCRMR
ncbi:MAG: thioredoxin fold domain-containing protein [Gammaproteobacteria bacterium]|nr:thioredoxin fold domain-containing protein [Gammaproteobacteria bacterium]